MYNVIDKHVATERKFPQVSKASARLAEGFQPMLKERIKMHGGIQHSIKACKTSIKRHYNFVRMA